jgi:deoxyribodipyrimidine photolyase-like uncharacterized protein
LGKYHYVSSFKIIENDDFSISLLDEGNFNNKRELYDLEGYYIREYKKTANLVNTQIPSRTKYEYKNDNKDRINRNKRERHQYQKVCMELRNIDIF